MPQPCRLRLHDRLRDAAYDLDVDGGHGDLSGGRFSGSTVQELSEMTGTQATRETKVLGNVTFGTNT
jgi:hypothetical protein